MSWTQEDEDQKISNAEAEYMAQWREAMAQRGSIIRDTTLQYKNALERNKYMLCPCQSGKKVKWCKH